MIKELYSRDVFQKSTGIYIQKATPTGGLVIVKADWCGHCQRTIPELEETSRKLGQAYPIFKIDADKNPEAVSILGVEGFPTIFYISRDGKVNGTFTGPRTVGSFLSGICEKSLVCRK